MKNSPLTEKQAKNLESLLAEMNPDQLAWVLEFVQEKMPVSSSEILILYGTESGNAESLAVRTEREAHSRGFSPRIFSMEDISVEELQNHPRILILVSTWGEGDPPQTAEKFFNELMQTEISLQGIEFSVCALGDVSYEKFCQTGKDIDTRLEVLGAKRIVERKDCDVDFDSPYEEWIKQVWEIFGEVQIGGKKIVSQKEENSEVYGKQNPFPAEVLENINLNFPPSEKETQHIELSLAGSGLEYLAGDTLAVLPENADDVVAEVLKVLKFKATEEVEIKGKGIFPLQQALKQFFDITTLSPGIAKKYQEVKRGLRLGKLLRDKEKIKQYCQGRQLIDLLTDYPLKKASADEFISILRKLPPRLYSIASSLSFCRNQVHLTVAAVRYESEGRKRKGVASTYLADECQKGKKVLVYTQTNSHFRLPEDSKTPIIMVGPGTGIAPFRAFLQERSQQKQAGEAWLFFGDRNYTNDFLYQLELQEFLKEKVLTYLDLAFSRDQKEKIYVQDKMLAKGQEIYSWLEKGAYFYVCGDASKMAGDVHQALLEIIQAQGKSQKEAEEYLQNLKEEKRYQRDVY